MANPTAKQYLNIIRKYLGYKGKKSAEQLDDYEANTSGKFNKFAAYFDELFVRDGEPLNTKKQGQDYCAIGLLYSAIEACNGDVYNGFDLLCQTWAKKVDSCAAGVAFMWNYFGYYGRQYTEPVVGDIAFVKDKKDGKRAHVCCVEAIDGDSITTLDFNWGNNVVRVTRDLSEFGGFGRPRFADPEPEEDVEPEKEPEQEEKAADNVTIPREEYNRYIAQLAELTTRATAAENHADILRIELDNIKEALKKLL